VTEASLTPSELAAFDPLGWHYAEQLAQRAAQTTGPVQALLCAKLDKVRQDLNAKFVAAKTSGVPTQPHTPAAPSPLAQLLQEMTPASGLVTPSPSGAWQAESPRIQQFRQQLGKISVQKQVSKAMAQAPQNAGPINSHMLVLRSLGLMRDASPDYLNRFMVYVDTLLCLDEAGTTKVAPRKSPGATASKK
jgi:hypothetical protein